MWRRAEIFNLRFARTESAAETKAEPYSHGYSSIALLRMSVEHAAYYDLHIFYATLRADQSFAPFCPVVGLQTVGDPGAQTEHSL